MKRTLLFALVALGFLSLPLLRNANAQNKFEGSITWSLNIPMVDEEKHEMIQNIKGDQAEIEIDMGPQGGVKTWIDNAQKKVYMYMAMMGKKGTVIDIPNEVPQSPSASAATTDIKATGKKATIAGHSADEYFLSTSGADVSLWMASDFSKETQEAFRSMAAANQQQDPKVTRAMKEFAQKGLVPVKMSMTKDGDVAMAMELSKVEQKSIDSKIFERPADVQFVSMAQQINDNNVKNREYQEKLNAESKERNEIPQKDREQRERSESMRKANAH